MKVIVKYGVKLPIEGVQFSNVETAIEWELEGDEAGLEKEIRAKVQAMVDEIAEDTAGQFKSVLASQSAKLEKAREEYIKLKENKS